MFRNISVERFRGIRQLRIDGLSRINLFFGKNNCGKSSLLEAMFLLSGQSNPLLPLNINMFREYTNMQEDDLCLEFYGMKKDAPIIISADTTDGGRRLSIDTFSSYGNKVETNPDISNSISEDYWGYRLNYLLNGQNYTSELQIGGKSGDNKIKVNVDSRYSESIQAKFIHPRAQLLDSVKFIQQLVVEKREKVIVEALQLIEPSITSLVFTGSRIMVDVGLDRLIPVNFMGDGIRKLLYLISAVLECRDGMVMIDEIDNGFHFSVMQILWKVLLQTAVANNVQLMISTHNIDSLRGLRDVLALDDFTGMRNAVMAYKLIRNDKDEIIPLAYDYEKFGYSLEYGHEMR